MNIFQALEQMQAFLKDFSPLLWSYKKELEKQGFTEEQAFELVKEYQNTIISQK